MVVSADVRLYQVGTPGERCALASQDGVYSFDDLPEGDYILAVYSPRHVALHERVSLLPGATNVMTVQLSPAGFLSRHVVDERGEPPGYLQPSQGLGATISSLVGQAANGSHAQIDCPRSERIQDGGGSRGRPFG